MAGIFSSKSQARKAKHSPAPVDGWLDRRFGKKKRRITALAPSMTCATHGTEFLGTPGTVIEPGDLT